MNVRKCLIFSWGPLDVRAHNPLVRGSTPRGPTNKIKDLSDSCMCLRLWEVSDVGTM